MKKIFSVMLAAALGLSLLSGCASSGTDAASSAAETTAAETAAETEAAETEAPETTSESSSEETAAEVCGLSRRDAAQRELLCRIVQKLEKTIKANEEGYP